MLISNKAIFNLLVTFDLVFDDETLNKVVECKRGDKVKIRFHDNQNGPNAGVNIVEATGIISHISVQGIPQYTDSLVGSSTDIHLRLDASDRFSSKVYNIHAKSVLDIDLIEEVPLDPSVPSDPIEGDIPSIPLDPSTPVEVPMAPLEPSTPVDPEDEGEEDEVPMTPIDPDTNTPVDPEVEED